MTKLFSPSKNDLYPAWVIKSLYDEEYIEENPESYLWFFTPKGREYFETPNDLQEFLMDVGGYNNTLEI